MQGQNVTQLKQSATPLVDRGKRKLSGSAKVFPPLFLRANRQQLEAGVAGHQWSQSKRLVAGSGLVITMAPPFSRQ